MLTDGVVSGIILMKRKKAHRHGSEHNGRLCFRSFSATDVRRGEMFTTDTVDRKLGTEERAALD